MLTQAKPTGSIKTEPEDFMVSEVVQRKRVLPVFKTDISNASGPLTEFVLTKRCMPAEAAYCEVAKQLGVDRRSLSDHGRKDTYAVTSQSLVVKGPFRPNFDHEQIWLKQMGPAASPLSHGGHDKNHFSILVRTDAAFAPHGQQFLNLFGPQRFGDGRAEVGKFLLEGRFEDALTRLEGSMNWGAIENLLDLGAKPMEALLHHSFRKELKFKVEQWWSWLWNQLAPEFQEDHLPTWSMDSAHLYEKWWNPYELDSEMLELVKSFVRPVKSVAYDHTSHEVEGGFRHEFALRSGAFATVFLDTLYDVTDVSRERYK